MALQEDAVDLVYWYEGQPDCGTYSSDSKIAEKLGWFLGGWIPTETGGRRETIPMTAQEHRDHGHEPDAGRVRAARRYVDRTERDSVLHGYSFGTKTNGAGVKFSMLYTPKVLQGMEAVVAATSEQLSRAKQRVDQTNSEKARHIYRLGELERHFLDQGLIEQAMCLHDCVKELQMFGQLTMATLSEARRLGLFSVAGGGTG